VASQAKIVLSRSEGQETDLLGLRRISVRGRSLATDGPASLPLEELVLQDGECTTRVSDHQRKEPNERQFDSPPRFRHK
jgi:hypothetical protein